MWKFLRTRNSTNLPPIRDRVVHIHSPKMEPDWKAEDSFFRDEIGHSFLDLVRLEDRRSPASAPLQPRVKAGDVGFELGQTRLRSDVHARKRE